MTAGTRGPTRASPAQQGSGTSDEPDAACMTSVASTCALEAHVPSALETQRQRVDSPVCPLALRRHWNLSPTLGANTVHVTDLEDPTDPG